MSAVAMQGTGASNMNSTQMSGKNARSGGPDLGEGYGAMLSQRELQARQHFVTPSNDTDTQMQSRRELVPATNGTSPEDPLPYWMNNYD